MQTAINKGNVALCYMRCATDSTFGDNTLQKQRANIEVICQKNGWTPVWYEDRNKGGHQTKNRPAFLSLKTRLTKPDVVAVIANDLARLSCNSAARAELLDLLANHNVQLVLAANRAVIDTVAEQRIKLVANVIMKEMNS